METEKFKQKLLIALSNLEYVEKVDIFEVSERYTKGNIYLKKSYILAVRFSYFSETLDFTLSFSLLYKNERIWGLDKDNKIGWHIHPLNDTSIHQAIEAKTIEEILQIFHTTISELLKE